MFFSLSDRQSQVPTIRDWKFKGATSGFRSPRRNERSPKIPDSQGRSVDRQVTLGPHLLQPAGPARLRDLRQAQKLSPQSHQRVLRGIWIRLKFNWNDFLGVISTRSFFICRTHTLYVLRKKNKNTCRFLSLLKKNSVTTFLLTYSLI